MNFDQKIPGRYLLLFAAVWCVTSFPIGKLSTSPSAGIECPDNCTCFQSTVVCNGSSNGSVPLPSGMRMLNGKAEENLSVTERRSINDDGDSQYSTNYEFDEGFKDHVEFKEHLRFELVDEYSKNHIESYEALSFESIDEDYKDRTESYEDLSSEPIDEYSKDHSFEDLRSELINSEGHTEFYEYPRSELHDRYLKDRKINEDSQSYSKSYDDISSELIDDNSENHIESYEELSSRLVDDKYMDSGNKPEQEGHVRKEQIESYDDNDKLNHERDEHDKGKTPDQESQERLEQNKNHESNSKLNQNIRKGHEENGGSKRDLRSDVKDNNDRSQSYRELSFENHVEDEDISRDQETQERQNRDQDGDGRQNKRNKKDFELDVYGFLFESNNTGTNNTHRKFFGVMKDVMSGSRITLPLELDDPFIHGRLMYGLNATLQAEQDEEEEPTLY